MPLRSTTHATWPAPKSMPFLKAHPKETKTSLARRMNDLPYVNNINIRNLSAFMSKNGYDAGNTSEAFYASYVSFEKLRIKQGKAKSKDRLEMERLWGEHGGFNVTVASHNKGVLMHSSERIRRISTERLLLRRGMGELLREFFERV